MLMHPMHFHFYVPPSGVLEGQGPPSLGTTTSKWTLLFLTDTFYLESIIIIFVFQTYHTQY